MLNQMIHIGKNQVSKRKADLLFMIKERENRIYNNEYRNIEDRYTTIAEIKDFKDELQSYI